MNIRVFYGRMIVIMSYMFGVNFNKKIIFYCDSAGRWILKKTDSLAGEVTYVELHMQSPLVSMCTDKYAVRDYTREKGLEDILISVVSGL